MKILAALFDLDGVVFDTEPQYTEFWGAQCREFRPDIPGLEFKIKGQTLLQIFDGFFQEAEVQRQITQRLNAFEQQMSYDYIPGFQAFIDDLRRRGIRTAVVTSSNLPKMASVYHHRPEFCHLFDAILTSEDFAMSKPDPDCYLKAAARFSARQEECLVFEDSINGLRSGRSAGMHVVGLATTNPKDVVASLSDVVIADYLGTSFEKILAELSRSR
jgi:HAD superfamily hydrolase (TIGR01509 family)